MLAPPFVAGCHSERDSPCPLPIAAALTDVGAPGTVAGVTATVESTLGPAALVATTEQLYVVPLVRPVTVSGEVVRRREAARVYTSPV